MVVQELLDGKALTGRLLEALFDEILEILRPPSRINGRNWLRNDVRDKLVITGDRSEGWVPCG